MHIDKLSDIEDIYEHVYLSPHLDDAALSCGGTIARSSAANARVLVVTICTAAPPPEGPFNHLAQEFHREWGLAPAEVVSARLREDSMAMERLGADSYWAGMADAIYRWPEAYTSLEALLGTPAPDDPLLPELVAFIRELRSRTPSAMLYAPLGIGNHVDHQITCAAALDGESDALAFYEDFPYVTKPEALDRRLRALDGSFVTSIIDIDATLTRKIGAIESYASQIGALFGDSETMRRLVVEYAEALRPDIGTYGERLWLRAARP
jgi:LmbE family N-acetylglucosaminyl deacetylase